MTKARDSLAEWFGDVDARAAAKVTVAVSRIQRGAFSNVKGVGEGVLEFRIDFGPTTAFTSGATATLWGHNVMTGMTMAGGK